MFVLRGPMLMIGIALAWFFALASCPVFAQGGYRPVVKEDVLNLELNHYFTSDEESHKADFNWRFRDGKFVLKKGDAPIPTELIERLLGKGAQAEVVRGKWKLVDGHLVLYNVIAGKQVGKKKVSLPIYRTAPTVVRIGEPQYVFAVKPPKE